MYKRKENMKNEIIGNLEPPNRDDFQHRISKARKLMSDQGMGGLFLTAGADLQYFTNIKWRISERTFGAFINIKTDPIWICPSFEAPRAKEQIKIGKEIRTWEEHESPYKILAGIIKDLGILNSNLGVGPAVPNFVIQGIIKDADNLSLVDGATITETCRSIKTEKEISFMEAANMANKMAFREGINNLQTGMSESDLGEIVQNAQARFGAVSGHIGPGFGSNSSYPHGSSKKILLKDGDIVIIDGGGSNLEGYMADVTRTVVFGEPSDKQKRIWDIVKKANQAAHDRVKPGVTCEEIDLAARQVIEDAGYGSDYQYFAHRLGHGIGMEVHEYPYLVRGNKLKLKPGMTFTNEPGIYIPGEFGIRIEDSFVVTDDGAKILGGMECTAIDNPFGE